MADVIQAGKTMPQIPATRLLPSINRLWMIKPQLRTDGAQLQMDFPLLPTEFALLPAVFDLLQVEFAPLPMDLALLPMEITLLPMEFMPPRMEKVLLHSDLHKIWPF
jgi:hypothetical protein